VGGVSDATGLGLLDLAIIEACHRVGAVSDAPYVKTSLVLDEVHERTGIGQRIAYEPLCNLARPWVVHLALIDFHGNYGDLDSPPAAARYTECRLTPLGVAALAAERGTTGPLADRADKRGYLGGRDAPSARPRACCRCGESGADGER